VPFTLPNLDQRTWDDLGAEARALIPMYAPDWTDHNPSDPGITIIEMLAWVIEQEIYRANRITARHQAAFLALLGERPAGPRAARVALRLRRTQDAGPSQRVSAGTEFKTVLAASDVARFVTAEDVDVVSAAISAIVVDPGEGQMLDATAAWRRGLPFLPLGTAPTDRSVLYLGFDRPLPAGVEITLLVSAVGGVPAATPRDEEARLANARGRLAITMQWEAYTGRSPEWVALPAERAVDDTRGFTSTGRVRVRLTEPLAANGLAAISRGATPWPQPAQAWWLRCRIVSGCHDAPPWLAGIDLNGTFAAQLERAVGTTGLGVTGSPVGTGTGLRDQVVDLGRGIVVPESLRVWTGAPDAHAWRRVDDLLTCGPTDAVFELDAVPGVLRFGDAVHGRPPAAGAVIWADFNLTLGASGNVAAQSSWSKGEIEAYNALPAAGGSDGESLDDAATRVNDRLWAHEHLLEYVYPDDTLDLHDREEVSALEPPEAVRTALDAERVALDVPGTRIARARAIMGRDPRFLHRAVSSTMTLVVVPFLPQARPSPSRELLEAVQQHLEQRRMIGTRIWVTAPEYVEVAAHVKLALSQEADKATVFEAVRSRLDEFLGPLGGGMDGRGWPFGQPVYRSQVLATVQAVPGVAHVLDLGLKRHGGPISYDDLAIGPTALTTPGKHVVM
jgi:hypothetical protein